MTTLELVEYYKNLLIIQYYNLTKASGDVGLFASIAIQPQTSVQVISFSVAPSSGSFVLSYNDELTPNIAWNAPVMTIQTDLQGLTGLDAVTVTGSIATSLIVTFTGVTPPALSLVVDSSSLDATITVTETDLTLPLAVQNAFNLIAGTEIAVGNQLDVLGKYAGVVRSGNGFTQPITLDDADFYTLIQMAIFKNSAGSSLATIEQFLNQFFPGQIYVFDSTQMFLTFLISSSVGSQDLAQMFVTQGLLPVPMAVGYAVIYGPTADYFSMRTYEHAVVNGWPLNSYEDYQNSYTWLDYNNSVYPPPP